ncbi:hypothetical protein [Chlorobium phaeovibrioides]|uniref:hypothetical protein n=1 Tax=Chlorobium phaeovibrioides TaxID=1094 RepID=UPI001CB98E11|nr:hypothetical protein [Chlorobium phaeovibrioides]
MRSRASADEKGSAELNTITGEGSVPLLLNYFPLKAEVPRNQRINAQFRSNNLSAQVLEFALPFFASAEGQVPTTLRIEGRTPSPDIYLTSSLRNTKIRVAPTEVAYTLNGEVVITPRQPRAPRLAAARQPQRHRHPQRTAQAQKPAARRALD